MPAYFSMDFEMRKSPFAIKDFCTSLIDSNLTFKSGCMDYKSDSFDDIIKWNQQKLDQDFELGHTEHVSNNYKDMLFEFGDFSEVRLFVLNTKNKRTFSFCLIIPEDDFLIWENTESGYHIHHKTEKMEDIKKLAQKIWASTDVLSIQTAWEGSDYPPDTRKIRKGTPPQAAPFCIIPFSLYRNQWDMPFVIIAKKGCLIEASNNWNYT